MKYSVKKYVYLAALACVSQVISGYAGVGAPQKGRVNIGHSPKTQPAPQARRGFQNLNQKPRPALPAKQKAVNLGKQHKFDAKKKKHCSDSSSSSSSKSRCKKFDYVIVGGGTAGAALAAKLSDPDKHGKFRNTVCVLEAGQDLSDNPLVAINNISQIAEGVNNPLVSTVKNTYPFDVSISGFYPYGYPEGIMWGGSSGHSFLLAVRGTPEQYDDWAALSGNSRWSYNNLLDNVIIPMEHYTPNATVANPSQRGFNGPLFITQSPPVAGDAFMQDVATATGVPINVTDYNDPDQGDVGICAIQQWITPGPNSTRSYAGNSYLRGIPSQGIPAIVTTDGFGIGGRKLRIISHAHANRVLFSKKGRAEGVEYTIGSAHEETLVVKASKAIILSSGAFSDPTILQRSGIGDQDLLDSFGIPVVFANSNVGANLTTHYGPQAVFGDVETTVNFPDYATGFIGFSPNFDERLYQLVIVNNLAFFPVTIADVLQLPFSDNVACVSTFDLVPESRGNVQIVTRDPFVNPLINLNLYSDIGGEDAARALEFYKTTVPAIAAETGTTILYPTPAQYAGGDAVLFQAGIDVMLIADHASSTCRMATSPADGVVDGNLKVFGVSGLYVASNSVVPEINRGNTSYTAYIVGLELARILRGEG